MNHCNNAYQNSMLFTAWLYIKKPPEGGLLTKTIFKSSRDFLAFSRF